MFCRHFCFEVQNSITKKRLFSYFELTMLRSRVLDATKLLQLLFFFFFLELQQYCCRSLPNIAEKDLKTPVPVFIFPQLHSISHFSFLLSFKLGFDLLKWPTFQLLKCARQTWLSQKALARWISALASKTSFESGMKLFQADSVLSLSRDFLNLVYDMHVCMFVFVHIVNS